MLGDPAVCLTLQHPNMFFFTLHLHYIRVHSAERHQQLPKWAVLSHIKCLSQCKVQTFQVVLYMLKPSDTRMSWRSFLTILLNIFPNIVTYLLSLLTLRRKHKQNLLSIYVVGHSCYMSKEWAARIGRLRWDVKQDDVTDLVEILAGKECPVAMSMKLCSKRMRLRLLLPRRTAAVARHRVVQCTVVVCVIASQYWRAAWAAQRACHKLVHQKSY